MNDLILYVQASSFDIGDICVHKMKISLAKSVNVVMATDCRYREHHSLESGETFRPTLNINGGMLKILNAESRDGIPCRNYCKTSNVSQEKLDEKYLFAPFVELIDEKLFYAF